MTRRFRSGLVVGKFAPLHRGHQLVIDRASADCDDVAIISYSRPEFAGCEPARRESWLGTLYPGARRLIVTDELLAALGDRAEFDRVPENHAPATDHRRFCGFLCRRMLRMTPDAVFTSEDYGDGFAAELTAYQRAFDPEAPAVTHVCVDRARTAIPVSGTAIRADIDAHRRWLPPTVYASFVLRVCLLGGESTGKTTLAAALAQRWSTAWAPEFGRELWVVEGGRLVFSDMARIATEQIRREDEALLRADRVVFCDTSPLTTRFYSEAWFARVDPSLSAAADRRYDLYVLCGDDFAFVQDGTRADPEFSRRQQAWYIAELARRGIEPLPAPGPLEQRVELVSAAVASLLAAR